VVVAAPSTVWIGVRDGVRSGRRARTTTVIVVDVGGHFVQDERTRDG